MVIFPFDGDSAVSNQFYAPATDSFWSGRVAPRAAVAEEIKKFGLPAGARLTGQQAGAIARRLGASIAVAGYRKPGGRLYVYVADLEARVAFVLRRDVGDSMGVKSFLADMRRYAGLSAHERATLAAVRFKNEPKFRGGVEASAHEVIKMSSSSVSDKGGANTGADTSELDKIHMDVSELHNIHMDSSELDKISFDDFDMEKITTDDLGL